MEAVRINAKKMKNIEVDYLGFAIAEVCRTALEFSGGRKWLRLGNLEAKNNSKKVALKIVQNCIVDRHTGGIEILFFGDTTADVIKINVSRQV